MAVAPQQLERLYGSPRRSRWTRAFGLRDIAVGLWLLRRDPRRGLTALRSSARAPGGRWWRNARALVRRHPALALGGAFLLGVTAARRLRGTLPARSLEHAEQVPPSATAPPPLPVQPAPDAPQLGDPILRESSDTTGIGSPIGDAPYASGSRY